jgi:hypothetical protein
MVVRKLETERLRLDVKSATTTLEQPVKAEALKVQAAALAKGLQNRE